MLNIVKLSKALALFPP